MNKHNRIDRIVRLFRAGKMSVQAAYFCLIYRGIPAKVVRELILEGSRYQI